MDKNKRLIIVGSGETAALAYEYFTFDSNYEVAAFFVEDDYVTGDSCLGLPLIGLSQAKEKYPPGEYSAFVAVSSTNLNRLRTRLYRTVKSMGYELASYISSKAFVWRDVKIGDNCFILEHNVLQPFVEVGNNVTLWSGNHIGHRTKIRDNVFISSHVTISGFCEIGEYSFLGVNSCVADGVKIEADNIIGLGSIIHQNTVPNAIYRSAYATKAKIAAKLLWKTEE